MRVWRRSRAQLTPFGRLEKRRMLLGRGLIRRVTMDLMLLVDLLFVLVSRLPRGRCQSIAPVQGRSPLNGIVVINDRLRGLIET